MIRELLIVVGLSVLTGASAGVSGHSDRRSEISALQGVAIPPSHASGAKYREIRNVMGRCLDVAGGVNENRIKVQIFDCNGSPAQQWRFTERLELRNVMGRCLDVAGGINANRNDVQIFDCNGSPAQQWIFIQVGGHLGIRNVMGRCLDVAGGINANRNDVQIFDCNGTKAQQWR